jgi:hypothetical protein
MTLERYLRERSWQHFHWNPVVLFFELLSSWVRFFQRRMQKFGVGAGWLVETSGRVSFPIPISHSSRLSPRAFLEHNWKEVATGQKIGQRDRSLSTGINSAKFVANMT